MAQSQRGWVKLFLVVTPDFVPGALVTLSSFFKHHPQSGREVFLLQRDLGEPERRCFSSLPFRYHYLDHDPRIAERTALLPIPPERRNRLLVLQAFQVEDSGPLLILDADLLIQGPLTELMELPGPIVGSGEELHQAGGWRDVVTLEEGYGPPPEGALTRTINTGVFRLDPELRKAHHYEALVERLEPDWWNGLKTDLTDQALLNHHFKDVIQLAPPGFNYVLRERALFERVSGLAPHQCPVLHFAGPAKPWIAHRVSSDGQDLVPAARRWLKEWLEVLERL